MRCVTVSHAYLTQNEVTFATVSKQNNLSKRNIEFFIIIAFWEI